MVDEIVALRARVHDAHARAVERVAAAAAVAAAPAPPPLSSTPPPPARFVLLYLAEAHAADEWPLGAHVRIEHHRTLAQRCDVARRFVAQRAALARACDSVFVDSIDDSFTRSFAAHPFRWYVFDAHDAHDAHDADDADHDVDGVAPRRHRSSPSIRLSFVAECHRNQVPSPWHGGYRGYALEELETFLLSEY